MPLGTSLASDIESLNRSPGDTAAACAQSWATLMGSYATAVIPASIGVTGAQAARQGALTGAFSSGPGAGVALLEQSFLAFATAVGAGMAPAFVAVPPPQPVGFATLATPTDDPAVAAGALAGLIDAWMRTGTATPAAGGSPVPWS